MDAERVSVRAIQTTRRESNLNNSSLHFHKKPGPAGLQYSTCGPRSIGVEVPLFLQFSIALFTGMVVATFVPPVRRSIPRVAEVAFWVALIVSCALGVMSVTDTNARDLSMSAIWGAEQVVNTIFGLLLGGVATWISDNRFAIASWLVIVAGADVLALVLIRSLRTAAPWTPRVRLREWMELPVHAQAVPARRPVYTADPLADVNRRLAGATAVVATAMLARTVVLSIWMRNVMLARASRVGRVRGTSRLEGLRDATAHLQFAARAWYAAAGEPAVSSVASKAGGAAVRTARAARRGLLQPAAERAGQVIDIRALLSVQSLGWYGPMGAMPIDTSRGEIDATEEPQRPDSLAS